MRVIVDLSWREVGALSLNAGPVLFPSARVAPGIYRFDLGDRVYIGETDQLRRRFSDLSVCWCRQATNIRLKRRLAAGATPRWPPPPERDPLLGRAIRTPSRVPCPDRHRKFAASAVATSSCGDLVHADLVSGHGSGSNQRPSEPVIPRAERPWGSGDAAMVFR